ncbi:MAG: energy-coupling factor transporter ATPase [Christensenellales bacterium]|nr:energy-coupling factor transporter ATPase [Clostridium sp.]MDY5001368.1 energy-coupling factor transporter ATPase [Eubacteriales bacterium]MCI7012885.1 energy-coupling factor transporter ATPase [Clostridium sp.]MDD5904007.1 energy-coupling factor transporter ATPase [Clostridium sp.]MDD5981807.1 energy-coupling factor transporter ATPase [Clostridium sp.]
MISVKNVKYTYDGAETQALKGISFDVFDGEFVAIVGHNGSGKSTVAKLMNALIVPDEGSVTVDGMDTADESRTLDIRKKVGIVFQNPDNQIVTTVVEEDVGFGPENLGVPTEEIHRRVHDALEAVDMLSYARSAPHMLSGGQKQRIAIAGMLAIEPQVLVLDEATAMLDPLGRKKIIDIVMDLHSKRGITVVMITQYMEEAVGADRIIVLNDGLVELIGKPVEVFSQGDRLRSIGLDVPVVVGIRDELISRDLIKPCDAMTAEELAEVLCPLLLKI